MMKTAKFICYGCRKEYTHVWPQERNEIPCDCGQINIAPHNAKAITGFCGKCGHAFDDHAWRGALVDSCSVDHAVQTDFCASCFTDSPL